jgi:hypothetical protein
VPRFANVETEQRIVRCLCSASSNAAQVAVVRHHDVLVREVVGLAQPSDPRVPRIEQAHELALVQRFAPDPRRQLVGDRDRGVEPLG